MDVIKTRRDLKRPNASLSFTYTGTYAYEEKDDGWELRLLSSGLLTLLKPVRMIDVFLVGGGGAGGASSTDTDYSYIDNKNVTFTVCGGGGGGGFTRTQKQIPALLPSEIQLNVVIGDGGASTSGRGGDGGASSIISDALGVYLTAAGGTGGGSKKGDGTGDYEYFSGMPGSGGSGGGMGASYFPYGANLKYTEVPSGGSDGSNSVGYLTFTTSDGPGGGSRTGWGQGTTTRAFEEPDGELFAGGGGGASKEVVGSGGAGGGAAGSKTAGIAGTANTGGGGGGAASGNGGSGGSGIVIIRKSKRQAS